MEVCSVGAAAPTTSHVDAGVECADWPSTLKLKVSLWVVI